MRTRTLSVKLRGFSFSVKVFEYLQHCSFKVLRVSPHILFPLTWFA